MIKIEIKKGETLDIKIKSTGKEKEQLKEILQVVKRDIDWLVFANQITYNLNYLDLK